jgi:hypothetical protein
MKKEEEANIPTMKTLLLTHNTNNNPTQPKLSMDMGYPKVHSQFLINYKLNTYN